MDLFIKPEQFVAQLSILRPTDHIADFGAGAGYFTLALAKKAHFEGVVYALDILAEPLDQLRSQAHLLNITNIRSSIVNLENPGGSLLDNLSIDAVFIGNILFQVAHRDALLQEAYRILKPTGYLIIVEYEENFEHFGPPREHRLDKTHVKKLIVSNGFTVTEELKPSESHYCYIAQKPPHNKTVKK